MNFHYLYDLYVHISVKQLLQTLKKANFCFVFVGLHLDILVHRIRTAVNSGLLNQCSLFPKRTLWKPLGLNEFWVWTGLSTHSPDIWIQPLSHWLTAACHQLQLFHIC